MNVHQNQKTTYHQYLEGGGELGQLTRSMDWSSTILGSPGQWSQSLLTTISIMLNSRFPMFLWWGPELIQFYNDAYRPSLGNNGKHPKALGQKGADCWQEIWPVIKPLIDQVMAGGESTWSEDQLIPIYRNDTLEDVYWTFSYSRVNDETGKPAGVLVTCNETTEKVKMFNDLKEAKRELEIAKSEAERQRDRLKRFFMQAPAGICILDGPDLVFELINPSYQQLFPGRDLMGKPLLQVVPEIQGQPIWEILQGVYETGKTFEGNELLIPLARKDGGLVEDRYFNFIYQARHGVDHQVDGILVFVFEVTEMVTARKELEIARDILNLAIETSGIGTWNVNLATGELTLSDRARAIHGMLEEVKLTLKESSLMIAPEYRKKIIAAILEAVDRKTEFNEEYPIYPMDEGKMKWIRATCKAYYDEEGKPVYISGTLLDITEQKQDDLRKNDFIGMVSHEMKTPLTSVNAYIQLLLVKAKEIEDTFAAHTLEKVNLQIKKMTGLINGFLNISRLESGKIFLNKEDFCLQDLILEIVSEYRLLSSSHDIRFVAGRRVIVNADRDKIGSVISNVLSNAIKYSPNTAQVTVACEQKEHGVRVSIQDEGIGIRSKDIEKLFDRFYRVQNGRTNNIAGFGIGLYLSAEIIQRHNGRIWVESETSRGSTFFFELPLMSPEAE